MVLDTNNYGEASANNWCLNSNTSHYMTPTMDLMTKVQPCKGTMHIIIGDGKVLNITHIGNISLRLPNGLMLVLNKTLSVPQLRKNLIPI